MKAKRKIKIRAFFALALALCMVFSLFSSDLGAALLGTAKAEASDSQELTITELDGSAVSADLTKNGADAALEGVTIDENEATRVIIVMEGDSVVEADASADPDEETEAKRTELEELQSDVVAEIEETVLDGEPLEVSYHYTWLLNGVAATVPYGKISEIEALSGVSKVLIQEKYEVCATDPEAVTDVAYPMTISDGEVIGRENTWADGYTGKGIKIAVIDTGIDSDHPNFGALSADKLTADSATEETVGAVLTGLNAYNRFEGLTADDVYYSSKIAFGFNYCDNNLNITHDADEQGDHGTHVAGIAAANQVASDDKLGSQVTGVAPDAQLYVMKVFGANGGAYTEDILAALEDALLLGADVINMSLGSSGGFTTDGEEIDGIYNRVSETGAVLAVSAGNAYTSGYGNAWGTDENLTENVDNAIISSPGTYNNALSVASLENAYYPSVCISVNGTYLPYIDGSGDFTKALSTLAGGEFAVVSVPGTGTAEDFASVNVTGKIALVQRGAIAFTEKCENAEAAGAVACLVYNNTDGSISMDLSDSTVTIPCASITQAAGALIIAALEENSGLKILVCEEEQLVASEEASEMSDFSSWGVAPDLSLEPDITAPGGNIYSTLNGGSYGLMSGTSMAAPNVAGLSALAVQYAKKLGYSGEELHSFVNALLMSASAPLLYSEDESLYYSPRKQGSGLANAYDAVTADAYLSVDGCDTPKAELGDDPERGGSYDFSFRVNNFGERALFYDLSTVAQTEGVDDAYAAYGLYFMSSTPAALNASTEESSESMALKHDVDDDDDTDSHDAYWIYQAAVAGNPYDEAWSDVEFRYNADGAEGVDADDVQAYLEALVYNESTADLTAKVLKVEAGETAAVSVNVTLDSADKEYFNTYYKNGGYVEGFTFLSALNADGVDLSLPYLAFYGDWTDADVLDSGYYWEDMEDLVYSQYPNCLFMNYDYYGSEDYVYPGENPYLPDDESIDLRHISLSPNGDGYADYINDMYVSLLRNAAELTFTYTDAETGEVYFEETVEHVSKSSYQTNYAQIVPYVYSWYGTPYDMTDANGKPLANGTKLLLTVGASIDYEGAETQTWVTPITVDTEAPELLGAEMTTGENGAALLKLTFSDNVSVSAVNLLNSSGTKILGQYLADDAEATTDENGNLVWTATYDITDFSGLGKMLILLGDYAYNESVYAINLNGEGESYGDLVGFQYDEYGDYGSWVSFDAGVDEDEIEIFISEQDFACAEYVNGIVYAQTKDGKLYGFPYAQMLNNTLSLETTYITTLENVYADLAYSYYDGKLYGLYTSSEDWSGEIYSQSEIYSINLQGEYYDENNWATVEAYQEDWVSSRGGLYGLALACDDEGSLYIMGTVQVEDEETYEISDSTAQLWKASWETSWGWTSLGSFQLVGDTAIGMNYRQSMTWDHNTETLYWAQFYPVNFITLQSRLIRIDPETAEASVVGTLSGETGCLFAPLKAEAAAKEEHKNVPTFDSDVVGAPSLNKSVMTLNLGGSETLLCSFDPWYSQQTEVTWTSDNESVATVDENGTVTGVSTGACTITVASVADPSLTDECTVTVSALSLSIQGTISYTSGVVGSAGDSMFYNLNMVDGAADLTIGNGISADESLDCGLQLGAVVLANGYLWACEWYNTGMIYQIDPNTGVVLAAYEPIDGDVLYGLTYSENTKMFTGICNTNLYVDLDLPMSEDSFEDMLNSYDGSEFTWHKLNLAEYLAASDENFNTGESGFGSTVDVVLCGITTIDRPFTFSYDTMENNYYKDYLGNWVWSDATYTSDVTYVLMDNVGRLWYVDEITGLYGEEQWGETSYYSEDGSTYISGSRNGVIAQDNGDGTYNVFYLRKMVETTLTDMYREGTMPRYTYHFSDLYYAGSAEDGSDVFLMSLYDYWNNGSSNELYLYTTGVEKEEFDEEAGDTVITTEGEMLYSLGNTGKGYVIATITNASVTGGLPYSVTK